MSATQEHLDKGLCIRCGHDRWRIHRHVKGWQTLTRVELSIDTNWGWFEIEDVYGDDFTETDDINNETASCERCGYELDLEDYDTPAVEAATHGRTL